MDEKIFFTKEISAKPFQMSSVEIIIPFHNQQSRVINLINDIFNTVSSNRYVITLVDDGSKNKKFIDQLQTKKTQGLRFLKHDKCKGFAASVNNALSNPFRKDIPFVAILHSDIRIKDQNWLFNLGSALNDMKRDGVKMVSAMTNNPCADVPQLKGSWGKEADNTVLSEGFLPMYCVIANRELFKRIGLLAEFPYAGVETEEFSYRMKKNGFKQAVCGKSWVEHAGRASISAYDEDSKVQEMLRKAREQFEERTKN